MAFVRFDTHTKFQAAFSAALAANLAPALIGSDSGDSLETVGITYNFTIPNHAGFQGKLFTCLSYDIATDKIIVTRGGTLSTQILVSAVRLYAPSADLYPSTYMHAVVDADTLDPRNNLVIDSMPSYVSLVEGDGVGFCRDPNTGALYESLWDYFIQTDHGGERYTFGYGKTKMTAGAPAVYFGPYQQYLIESVTAEIATDNVNSYSFGSPYNPNIHQMIAGPVAGAGLVNLKPNALKTVITPNVLVFDNVVIFCFDDLYGKCFISVMERGTSRWLGSRMLPFGPPMQLCPTGTDRGMMICWQNNVSSSPLIAVNFEWDRSAAQLIINRVETVVTGHSFDNELHRGHATYDSNRQAVVLLDSDHDTFERFVSYNLCHPGRPSSIQKVIPISAVTTEKNFQGLFFTGVETNPTPIPSVYLSYGSTPTSFFSTTATTVAGTDDDGIGRISLNLASGSSNGNVIINTYLSSYSVQVSATLDNGTLYGIDPMIIAASATFTVSANVSASLAIGVIAATTILAGRPALQSDAVGAGTPQELSYPTSALNTPLVFETNPTTYTNIASELLTRPLYQSQRTLSKTATVQFDADQTDLQIELTWRGGGNSLSMTWAFFSQLYNYFNNPPNFQTDGYIRWAPKDLNNHIYNVLLVNLEVGGSNSIKLNNLYKTLDGYVTEEVKLTLRIVSTVS